MKTILIHFTSFLLGERGYREKVEHGNWQATKYICGKMVWMKMNMTIMTI